LKPETRNSLLKELNLAMSDLTPRKRKLYHRIWRKESTLCELRKKYRSRKLKDLCDVDTDPLMTEISNSLNAEAVRLLTAIIRNSGHKLRGRRWNFEDKILALPLPKLSPIYMCLMYYFAILCRKCLRKISIVVSCLMKCQPERMSGLIRNLRILEVRAGCATLQIMLCFSWFEVCIGSRSSQWLTTCHGSTTAEILVQFLNEVLSACYNVGLHVVATVCDMGTNNVKALKLLGSIIRKPFFQFQNQAITIYDPPHILK
jgi:hypothetical protein